VNFFLFGDREIATWEVEGEYRIVDEDLWNTECPKK